jgi:CII-binding regulator of phage lambda lysogenization HflD
MTKQATVENDQPVNPVGNTLPITLNITLEEANLILVGLGELKHSIVAPLVEKIKAQGETQVLQSKAEPTSKLLNSLMERV